MLESIPQAAQLVDGIGGGVAYASLEKARRTARVSREEKGTCCWRRRSSLHSAVVRGHGLSLVRCSGMIGCLGDRLLVLVFSVAGRISPPPPPRGVGSGLGGGETISCISCISCYASERYMRGKGVDILVDTEP